MLPHGNGKKVKVAVFTQGANAEAAKEAGADIVGMEDLAEQMKAGDLDFDVVIASPDAMRVVGQLGQLLGPRGLMPNPKVGTVTPDVADAVRNAKAGQVRFRTDKGGIIHCRSARRASRPTSSRRTCRAAADLQQGEAGHSQGRVPASASRCRSTMGPGVLVDQRVARRARRQLSRLWFEFEF